MKEAFNTFARFDLSRFAYPQGDEWALPTETMQLVGRLVELLRPRKVIEFGSGLSTVVVASLLREYGGKLLSFDHSTKFTRAPQMLCQQDLDGVARVAHRAITLQNYGGKVLPTYSIRWRDFEEFNECGLALIDGPPGEIGREAVLYELFPRLAVGGVVIVDDMNRDLDRNWLQSWKRVFGDGLEVEHIAGIGRGVALLRKLRKKKANYRFGPIELFESWRRASSRMNYARNYE